MKRTTAILLSVFLIEKVLLSEFSLVERGRKYSEEDREQYKIYLKTSAGDLVSAWHDLPLYTEGAETYNMVVEIPRFSQAKFEINREMRLNPLVQDVAEGKPRFLANVFPWHGTLCNYGAFPQTWENPFQRDPWTNLPGDKDPIDVCEIGSNPFPTGSVVPVKVLGILGLIDKSETDWKVIVLNAKEAEEKSIKTMKDLESSYPHLLTSIRKFFRIYKVPSGKPENQFAFDGEFQNEDFAQSVIRWVREELGRTDCHVIAVQSDSQTLEADDPELLHIWAGGGEDQCDQHPAQHSLLHQSAGSQEGGRAAG